LDARTERFLGDLNFEGRWFLEKFFERYIREEEEEMDGVLKEEVGGGVNGAASITAFRNHCFDCDSTVFRNSCPANFQ
jgi:hypothetical protein